MQAKADFLVPFNVKVKGFLDGFNMLVVHFFLYILRHNKTLINK